MTKRGKLPPPSPEEIAEAIAIRHEVEAFSVQNDERRIFLKAIFRNGDSAIFWFDAVRADDLLRHLERLFYGTETHPDRGSKIKTAMSSSDSYGSIGQPPKQNPPQDMKARRGPPKKS